MSYKKQKLSEPNEPNEPRFPINTFTTNIPVTLSQKILDQIKYLTTKISQVEWSGILFYSVEGNLDNINEYKIILESIYPMDKGSSGYTEFDVSEDFIGYRMDHPETLKWNIGLIHSHNSMKAFFSGTDMDELNVTSRYHNFYLSIIVNNALDVVGKLAFIGVNDEPVEYSYKGFQGKNKTIAVKSNLSKVMFVYNCDIHFPINQVDTEFISNVNAIINKKQKLLTKYTESKQLELPLSDFENGKGFNTSFNDDPFADMWEDNFPTFWLSFGELDAEHLTALDCIKMLEKDIALEIITIDKYVGDLISNNYSLYNSYFAGTDITLLEAMQTTHDYFEIYRDEHKIIDVLLENLHIYIMKLKNKHHGN